MFLPLFWFTGSQRYTEKRPIAEGSEELKPHFLMEPKSIFARIWKTPAGEDSAYSLLD